MRPRALSPSPAVRRPGSWVGTRPRSPKPKEAEKHRDRSETSWPHTGPAGKFARLPSSPPPPTAAPQGKALNPSPEQGPMFWPPAPKQRGRERMCVPDAAALLAPAWTAAGAAVGHVPVTYCLNQNRTHPHSGLAVLMRVQMAFEK